MQYHFLLIVAFKMYQEEINFLARQNKIWKKENAGYQLVQLYRNLTKNSSSHN